MNDRLEFPPCMGGCIVLALTYPYNFQRFLPVWEGVSVDYFLFVADMLRFLPVWEGVSLGWCSNTILSAFPPCMGGCIGIPHLSGDRLSVSSLYGRVYRIHCNAIFNCSRFLPVWEGVSIPCNKGIECKKFPPCMGGCIAKKNCGYDNQRVSSLYGRVYRF